MKLQIRQKKSTTGHGVYWYEQCSGSMTFWCVSGFGLADQCLQLMDPDPDPAIFVIDLQDANKKLILKKSFTAYYIFKVHLHNFSEIKSPK
jgi:hypothetical protein